MFFSVHNFKPLEDCACQNVKQLSKFNLLHLQNCDIYNVDRNFV